MHGSYMTLNIFLKDGMNMPKFNIQYAVLSDDIVVLKKPTGMTMQSFLRLIYGSITKAAENYDLTEILRDFRKKKSSIDFDAIRKGFSG